jgi:hypothetical protein
MEKGQKTPLSPAKKAESMRRINWGGAKDTLLKITGVRGQRRGVRKVPEAEAEAEAELGVPRRENDVTGHRSLKAGSDDDGDDDARFCFNS